MAGIENLGNTTSQSKIETQSKQLDAEVIKKALEGSGELADVPQLVQKIVDAALLRSRDLNLNISSGDLAQALQSVKEAHSEYASELGKKENELALRQVIERLYGLQMITKKQSKLAQQRALEVKQLEERKRNAKTPEDKEAVNDELAVLMQNIEKERNLFAQQEQAMRTAALSMSIQEISKESLVDTLGGTDPEKRKMIRGALDQVGQFMNKTKKGTTATFSDTASFLKNFASKIASLRSRSESADLKASSETAQKLAKELSVEIAKLNEFGDRDIRKQPMYPATHFRWWHPLEQASKRYIGRAGELVTSVGEDAALISATSYGIAAAFAIPAISVSNNPAGWGALATVTTLLATLSLSFKSSIEAEAVKAKRALSQKIPAWLVPVRFAASGLETTGIFLKAAAKSPGKALAAGVSTWAVGSALTKAILISLQSQAVTEQGVAGHIDAVKQELSVLQDAEGLTPSMKIFDGFIDISKIMPDGLLGGKSNQPQERQPGEGLTILERVDAQPAELLRRMQVSIRAEAGDPAAVREASQWGVPLSGKAGLGPRAVALSQLFGMTLEEAQMLTGLESGEVQDLPQGVREAQAKIRDFALANGLDTYLTEDEMANPQAVLEALSEQFGDTLSPKIAVYKDKYDNFFTAVDAITGAGDATAFVETFTGQPTTSPEDIDYYANQLKAAARDIQGAYTEYSQQTADLSQTIGQGIKSIYVTYNTAGAASIDVNKIKLAPEALTLDFTNLDKMVSDIKMTMQAFDAPESTSRSEASIDVAREQSRLAEHLEDAGIRLDRLADFVNPLDEIEAIVALESGKDSNPEMRDQQILWKTLQIIGMSLGIQFAMLLTVNLPAIRRLQKVQEEWGDQHTELISNAEDRIVEFIQKRMNQLIHQSHATINRLEKKYKSITFAFPYEPVSSQDVRRVLRSVGNKEYVQQSELRQLFNRGPDIDIAVNNRYSNWLFALGKAKNAQTIIGELLPGWDDGREHIRRMQQAVGEKKSGEEKAPRITGRWHDMSELTPDNDVRAYEIAVLSESNRRAELDIALHEAWMNKNKEGKVAQLFKAGKSLSKKMVSDTVSIARRTLAQAGIGEVRAEGDDLWANTFRAAAESKSVLNQMQGRLTTLRNKLEARRKRIEEVFKDLSKNHILYKYDKARKQLTEAYKSKYLYAYDKAWWEKVVEKVAPFARPDFEKQVAKITKEFKKSEGKDKKPFDTFNGYFDDLIERITAQQNETTPDVIKQRVEALLPIVEKTRVGFEKSINKTFGEGHSVEFDLTEGDGGAKVKINIQGPLGDFTQEASVTPAIMSMAGEDDLERAAGTGLLGPVLWGSSRKNFNFNPNDKQIKKVGNSKELVGAYIQLWEKMQEAAKRVKQQEKQPEASVE